MRFRVGIEWKSKWREKFTEETKQKLLDLAWGDIQDKLKNSIESFLMAQEVDGVLVLMSKEEIDAHHECFWANEFVESPEVFTGGWTSCTYGYLDREFMFQEKVVWNADIQYQYRKEGPQDFRTPRNSRKVALTEILQRIRSGETQGEFAMNIQHPNKDVVQFCSWNLTFRTQQEINKGIWKS